jgi:hypothetical protein
MRRKTKERWPASIRIRDKSIAWSLFIVIIIPPYPGAYMHDGT